MTGDAIKGDPLHTSLTISVMNILGLIVSAFATLVIAVPFHLGDEIMMKMCMEEAAPMPLSLEL